MTSVLIDGRPLYDDSKNRGVGEYLRGLLQGLSVEPAVAVSVLSATDAALPRSIRRVPVRRRLTGTRFGSREHEFRLPREIRRAGPDVYHSPGFHPPWSIERPWVQTVHDVMPLEYDAPGMASEQARWRRIGPRIARADAVITDSHYTAETAIKHLGLDPGRVRVIYIGANDDLTAPATPPAPDPPYVLYVGEYGPWKGYPEAFEVIAALADRGFPHHLKVAGRLTPWTEPTVRGLVENSRQPDRVELVGYVPRAELVRLYQAADALVVTSRFEGFGLPSLEAMATGTPVVAFDNTAVSEVVGDGGVLVADGDTQALADELAGILSDPASRERLSRAGRRRARAFSWKESARRHAEVYARVSEANRGAR